MQYTLQELIDTEKLKLLLDNFYNLTALTVVIFDLDGKMLLSAGSETLCFYFRDHYIDWLHGGEDKEHMHRKYRMLNRNHNVAEAVFKIKVYNECWAVMFAGQFLANHEEKLIWSEEKFICSLDVLTQIGELISDRGFVQLQQKQAAEALILNNKQLEHTKMDWTDELFRVNMDLKYDIWRREQAERALRDSEKRLCSVLENMPIMMQAIGENSQIVFFNHEGERVTGYRVAEVVNNPYVFITRYPEAKYREYVMKTAGALKFNYHGLETDITCKNGSVKTIAWYNISRRFPIPGWKTWMFGVDITEHKKLEGELRKTALELSAIFEALPDLYFRFDQEGTYLDSKVGNTHDLYIEQSEYLGRKVQDVLPEAVGKQFFQAIQKVVKTKSPTIFEYALPFAANSKFFEARVAPLFEDQVIAVVHNITERKLQEAEMLKMEKLEAVGLLAAGIAHDFNNVLTAVMGNISLAEMYIKKGYGEKAANCLQEAKIASGQATELSGQLLTFAKGGAPILKTLSIGELIRQNANFVLHGSKVSCNFIFADDVYPVDVDAGQISQVINNLIINAKQAMINGGKIKVVLKNAKITDESNLPLPNGSYVKIEIHDNGSGIAVEHLSKIFDPYFTTKPHGNGLGLSTVYAIIKKHNGYIAVDSTLNIGTTFSLYLPASSHEYFQDSKKKVKLHPIGGKILVMDDEKMVRDVVEKMLNLLECKAEFAPDGQTAVALYRQAYNAHCPFDAVIMDLTVPGEMGGKEALQKLRELDPQVKAIVSSGYTDAAVIVHYQEYGFQSFVIKPYNIEDLSESLRKVMLL